MILASFIAKRGISAILILNNGIEVKRCVYKYESDGQSLTPSLTALTKTLAYLGNYLDTTNAGKVADVVFETSNSHIYKWLTQGYSRTEYMPEFYEVFRRLEMLPIRYTFRQSKPVRADIYCSEKYIEKPKLSGFDFMEGIEDA